MGIKGLGFRVLLVLDRLLQGVRVLGPAGLGWRVWDFLLSI